MQTNRQFQRVLDIIDEYDRNPDKLIPILQKVQEEYRYLPEEIMTLIATSLGISPAKVYGVATFYAHFTLKPKGKYLIRLCDGTACHVKRSTDLLDALRKRLGLTEGRDTTPDLLFTIETVSCLGACGLAPVITVNDEVHGLMTPEKAVAVIDEIMAEEAAQNAKAV
jgi:NADH-quinone oxidoreductase subunit E